MAEEIKEVPTELDVIVQEINHLHQQEASRLWPNHGCRPSKSGSRWMSWTRSCRSRLGKTDSSKRPDWGSRYPASAKAKAVTIDLSKMGISSFTGSPGTGRPLSYRQPPMDLARKQSPENLTMYLLDFGTNGLANPLTPIPHVVDSLLLDQTEKIQKFIRSSTASWIVGRSSSPGMGSAPSPSAV